MKRVIRKSVSLLLAVMMMVSVMPGAALAKTVPDGSQMEQMIAADSGSVQPKAVAEAVAKFSEAMSKFIGDTSKMTQMESFFTHLGGVTSAASGVIGILQMSGIVEDPTRKALNEILDSVHSIQDQLDQMNTKLDDIRQDLVSVQVSVEEKDRNNNAASMLKNWNDFNRDYCEPLDGLINEYQGMINGGIRSWWTKGPENGIRLVYSAASSADTETADDTYLNYTLNNYEDLPEAADNGEVIIRDLCVGVPLKWMPDTSSIKFSIDSYRSDFRSRMTENFLAAAQAKELDATDEWYRTWEEQIAGLDENQVKELASRYADDILNTQIYRIACDVMSDNDAWVIKVTNAYTSYCNNILKQDSGINAMLNAFYLTHGFEGEVKDDIRTFCDAMVVKCGVYGQFALTCAGQDDMQSKANRQNLQNQFADTVISLGSKEELALTGHDNFCYVTGTRMEYTDVDVTSSLEVHNKGTAYKGYTSTGWKAEIPNLLNNVYAQVLFRQYRTLNQGQESFSAYLTSFGVLPAGKAGSSIMTRYGGSQTFALSEGISMKANHYFAGEEYFTPGQYYRIDVGTGSKVEQKYYHVHDKVLYDTFDLNSGELKVNQLAGARAFYGESHDVWYTDEPWSFWTDGIHSGANVRIDGKDRYTKENFQIRIPVLRLIPVKDVNGDLSAQDPFFAFESPVITEGISDVMGSIVADNINPLTDVKLEQTSFTYTGEPIEPGVTVSCAGKKLSSGYTVTYDSNTEIGIANVTVEGTGNYSGKISRQFRIVPKGTSIKKIRKSRTSARVKWKKQAADMNGRITGYQIRYSTRPSMKKAKTVTVTGYSKKARKIRGLKKNKKYYFQIRTFITLQGSADSDKTSQDVRMYSKWSGKKAAK